MTTNFHRSELLELASDRSEQFRTAVPFPHVVIDDLFPSAVIETLIREFPGPGERTWLTYDTQRELKLALEDEEQIPEPLAEVLRELNSQLFVEFLEKLSGIPGLIPDPRYRGGGLHQIMPGGMLKLHADFDMHPHMRLRRRLNVLLYLNEDWDDAYGGKLELWDKDVTTKVASIAPVANRLVVFETTDDSFHGHPDPLSCPPGRSRRSMAWYYYTVLDEDSTRGGRTPIFKERPGESITTRREDAWAKFLRVTPRSVKDIGKWVLRK